jgi:hypothetical protein
MSKPLTTLGDALAAKGSDWRADLRAADIPRRPPPSSSPPSSQPVLSRPDRGYVEQPEERRDTQPSAPQPRRRTETPTLTAPVALVRLERRTVYSTESNALAPSEPPPAIPAAAPPEADMPKAVAKTSKDGRRFFTDEYRAKVLAAFDDGQKQEPKVSQKAIADRFELHQSVLSNWLTRRAHAAATEAAVAKRAATRAANKASKAAPSDKTPAASVAAASTPRGVRSFETVSLELAGAIAKVSELKRELRALLGDE